jgi:hypothetical protein
MMNYIMPRSHAWHQKKTDNSSNDCPMNEPHSTSNVHEGALLDSRNIAECSPEHTIRPESILGPAARPNASAKAASPGQRPCESSVST